MKPWILSNMHTSYMINTVFNDTASLYLQQAKANYKLNFSFYYTKMSNFC